MTQEAFQAILARLVMEPGYQRTIQATGRVDEGNDLTAMERRRILAVAHDPGLTITRTIHRGWRLGKLLSMLPHTCTLLGRDALADEVGRFWSANPPRSLYFRDEAISFCEFLVARPASRRRSVYLAEVVGYERSSLELLRPDDGPAPPRLVEFQHDPVRLLSALAAGKRPRRVPRRSCLLVGMAREGEVTWRVLEPGEPPLTCVSIDPSGAPTAEPAAH